MSTINESFRKCNYYFFLLLIMFSQLSKSENTAPQIQMSSIWDAGDKNSKANIVISTQTLSFGYITVGNSKILNIKITNNSVDSSLKIYKIRTSTLDFSIDRDTITISAGLSDSINVNFSPKDFVFYKDSITISCNDSISPSVIVYLNGWGDYNLSVAPLQNANNVLPSSEISMSFPFEIDASSIDNSTVKIIGSIYGGYSASFVYNNITKTISINTQKPFLPGEVVTVTATRGIKGSLGDSIVRGYSWRFTIKSEASSWNFNRSIIPVSGGRPVSISVGDFNKDGWCDFATANEKSSTISIFINNGMGGFTENQTIKLNGTLREIKLGDFDGDGYLDIVARNGFQFMLNNGDGRFTLSDKIIPYSGRNMAIGDLNNDGKIDISFNPSHLQNITSYNNGNLVFNSISKTLAYMPATNFQNGFIDIGDISRNGNIETAISSSPLKLIDLNNDRILESLSAYYRHDPYYDFTVSPLIYSIYYGSIKVYDDPVISSADVDGNKYADIILLKHFQYPIMIFKNNGNGYTSDFSYGILITDPTAVSFADVNGDKKLDILITDGTSNSVTIFYSKADAPSLVLQKTRLDFGLLQKGKNKSVRFILSNNATSSTLNVNNIVSSNNLLSIDKSSLTIPPQKSDSLTITYYAQSIGNHLDTLTFGTNDSVHQKVSIAVSNTVISINPEINNESVNSDTTITIEFGSQILNAPIDSLIVLNGTFFGEYSFKAQLTNENKSLLLKPTKFFAHGEEISTILRQSINLVSQDTCLPFSWKFNIKSKTSTGKMAIVSAPLIVAKPIGIVSGDFNRDGFIDLATANFISHTIAILFNDGLGSFVTSKNIQGPQYPSALIAVDYDRDGFSDLAVVGMTSNNVVIYRNINGNQFAETQNIVVGKKPNCIITSDLNCDGYYDLAVANEIDNTVTLLMNNKGKYSPAKILYTGARPVFLAVGDINKDGKPDLVVANYTAKNISLFLNDGNGNYSIRKDIPIYGNPIALNIADINNDTNLDIMATVVNPGTPENNMKVLINDGVGDFIPITGPKISFVTYTLNAADYNGDGLTEVAVANTDSNIVSIYRFSEVTGFVLLSTALVGNGPISMTQGDYNNDGKIDVAVANYDTSTVSILLNSPSSAALALEQSHLIFEKTASTNVPEMYVKLKNIGMDSTLKISYIFTLSQKFSINRSTFTIAKDQEDSILVKYIGNSEEEINDTMFVESNSISKVLKIALTGKKAKVTSVQRKSGTPNVFALYQNYPNPFNPTTTISYDLPIDSKVTIDIYDILGRKIHQLIDEQQIAGYYAIPFNGISLSSGIYFYSLHTRSFSTTKKMIITK